ncbi:uncharacterized protein SETTUDRAFT_30463 [Exserohilum turcica Et28A]|uniref:Uncharacterized protein n=1 Tax=Exserohilum turcicum (strain 28A) TaxID=671987 RepID=R0J5F0_EXST2|nr:uncharacterized protein SETTUDRAFT_30463 [Exserohilum turcica Et28A]EOA91971.1 hypothetical protein SETTUDRAFT_30463 [Exserohilum turcica Et28A]
MHQPCICIHSSALSALPVLLCMQANDHHPPHLTTTLPLFGRPANAPPALLHLPNAHQAPHDIGTPVSAPPRRNTDARCRYGATIAHVLHTHAPNRAPIPPKHAALAPYKAHVAAAHTPLPSTVVAQMHRVAALPEPHSRSNPQSESHGGDAHTPLTHSLPDVHALPQRPQCCRSVLVSRQLPSHTCTPAPPHTGAALGVALLLELLVVVVVLSDGSTVVDDSTLDKDVLLTKEVLLASVLDSLRLVVTMLDVDELGSPLLDDVIVSLPDGVTETLLDEVIVALPDDVTGMLLDEVIVSLPDDTAARRRNSNAIRHGNSIAARRSNRNAAAAVARHARQSADCRRARVAEQTRRAATRFLNRAEELVVEADHQNDVVDGTRELFVANVLFEKLNVLLGDADESVIETTLVADDDPLKLLMLLNDADELLVTDTSLVGTTLVPDDDALELSDELDAVDVTLELLELLDALAVPLGPADVAELDEELSIPLDLLLEDEDDPAKLDTGELTGQEVPVVTTAVNVVVAVFVTVYQKISLLISFSSYNATYGSEMNMPPYYKPEWHKKAADQTPSSWRNQ